MSLLEPVPSYGSLDDSERQSLLQRDRPPTYSQEFPGDPDSRSADADPRGSDIQALEIAADRIQELQIEDTSQRSRRVKGAINRINYWAANSNSCYHANQRILGRHLMSVCCCGGGQGSACGDISMFIIYVWFSVLCPGIAVVGVVQLAFLIINQGAALEWAILVNSLLALATLCYIADILRRNYNRFLANPFCIPIAAGLLPGSINAFMTLTISNINRVQLLGVHHRELLAAQLQQREDMTIHVMMYSRKYIAYVYRRPKVQLIVAIVVQTLLLLAQGAGMWWQWSVFRPTFMDGWF